MILFRERRLMVICHRLVHKLPRNLTCHRSLMWKEFLEMTDTHAKIRRKIDGGYEIVKSSIPVSAHGT